MKSPEIGKSERWGEKAARIYSTINKIGAVALIGASVVFPEFAPILIPLAAIDITQSVVVDSLRNRSKNKKQSKQLGKLAVAT